METVSRRADDLRGSLRKGDDRMREIDKTLRCWQTYKELKPVRDAYFKKNFKKTKEKFYAEHKDELDSFNQSFRYLLKHGAEKEGIDLRLDTKALRRERSALERENTDRSAELQPVLEEMKLLRSAVFYLYQVLPLNKLQLPDGVDRSLRPNVKQTMRMAENQRERDEKSNGSRKAPTAEREAEGKQHR